MGKEVSSPEEFRAFMNGYLASLPNKTTAPKAGRLRLLKPLPVARFGSEEIQPWRGVQPASASAGVGAAAPAAQTVSQGRP